MKGPLTRETAPRNVWAEGCEAWTFVDTDTLSVKLERMQPGTTEMRHRHSRAQQFFYILAGEARFEVGHETIFVSAGQGLHIKAGEPHLVANEGHDVLEFILSSEPATTNDRINEHEQ
ncbi:MAG: cupin [Flaviaesturariibacter sp.]|nr:cupin [Flaviaesturariibacter sp.]